MTNPQAVAYVRRQRRHLRRRFYWRVWPADGVDFNPLPFLRRRTLPIACM